MTRPDNPTVRPFGSRKCRWYCYRRTRKMTLCVVGSLRFLFRPFKFVSVVFGPCRDSCEKERLKSGDVEVSCDCLKLAPTPRMALCVGWSSCFLSRPFKFEFLELGACGDSREKERPNSDDVVVWYECRKLAVTSNFG